ncbi:MAG: PAS domain S-box protein [Thiotrichaceae bacterium]
MRSVLNRISHQTGQDFSVEVTVNFLEFNGENMIFAFINDISARKQMEERRTQAALKFSIK